MWPDCTKGLFSWLLATRVKTLYICKEKTKTKNKKTGHPTLFHTWLVPVRWAYMYARVLNKHILQLMELFLSCSAVYLSALFIYCLLICINKHETLRISNLDLEAIRHFLHRITYLCQLSFLSQKLLFQFNLFSIILFLGFLWATKN